MNASKVNGLNLIVLLVLFLVTIFIHELGHAIRLRLADKSIGDIKLFANFYPIKLGMQIDTSESYMLERKKDKISVALGGVYAQLAFNGIVALVLYMMNVEVFDTTFIFVLYTVGNWIIIISNLIPFMKLDGYWILSHYLGINNLSDKSVNMLKDFIRINFLGAREPIYRNYQDEGMERHKFFYSTYGFLYLIFNPVSSLALLGLLVYISDSIVVFVILCVGIVRVIYKGIKFIYKLI